MVDLGSISFRLDVPSIPKSELEEYATRLFDVWEEQARDVVRISDFSVSLQIEEGSIKGMAMISGGLYAVYMGIGHYGSFISGLQTINGQVSYVNTRLTEIARSSHGGDSAPMTVQKRQGTLGRLERLFDKVQRGDLTVSEAMKKAEELLGDEALEVPDFMKELERSLVAAPAIPEQLALPMDEVEETKDAPVEPQPSREKRERSLPIYPPPLHLRVEVWRESKSGKRNIKVTEV
jgi:hypothetical protein